MNIGAVMVFLERWRYWVTIAQFLMVLQMFVKSEKADGRWMVAGLLLSILWTIFVDMRYIYPRFQEKAQQMNPAWTELSAKLDKLIEAQNEKVS